MTNPNHHNKDTESASSERFIQQALAAVQQARTNGGEKLGSQLLTDIEYLLGKSLSRLQADNAELCRFRLIAENTDDLVVQANREGVATYVSPCLQNHLGVAPDDFLGKPVLRFLHPDDVPLWLAALRSGRQSGDSLLLRGRWRRKDGSYLATDTSIRFLYENNGQVLGTIAISRSVGAAQALEAELSRAAKTDALTGLLNRAGLTDVLRNRLLRCQTTPLALLVLNIDRFNQVNESLGTDAGDQLLKAVGRRIAQELRPGDGLARIGADEFVAVLSGISAERDARAVAKRVQDAVGAPLRLREHDLLTKTSVGLALCMDSDLPMDELRSRANRALDAARRKGGARAEVYNDSLTSVLREAFIMERRLESALIEGRLVAHFQPIVDRAGRLVAAEALVRIREADGTLVPPAAFIDVAESSGLILPLGRWVLQQACVQSQQFAQRGLACIFSVNVSPKQLLQDGFVADVLSLVQETGAKPCNIMLELTETTVMENLELARTVLAALRDSGFKIALDDFGTGYSSIATLKSLPFDTLKVDRSFVRDVSSAQAGSATLASIVQMAKAQGLRLVAEGVETEEQCNYVSQLGCEMLQGFFFARPGPAEHLLPFSGRPQQTALLLSTICPCAAYPACQPAEAP